MINILKKDLKNWNRQEISWLCISTIAIMIISLMWKDDLIGIISAISGVLCVVFTGKGKASGFLLAIVNVILYGYISYKHMYYGDAILNILFYLPMNVLGWFCWTKHLEKDTGEVIKTKVGEYKSFKIYIIGGVITILYGNILKSLGGNLPYLDAITSVFSVIAQIMCVKRLAEQWTCWILVNFVSMGMWLINFLDGGDSIATLIMWGVYLMNAIMMDIKWRADTRWLMLD